MAKVKTKSSPSPAKKAPVSFEFPLGRTNYIILLTGLLLLIVGYVFMAIPDDPDAFLTRTLAPIILVFSFLIVIPIGLLYKDKKKTD